MGIEPFTIVVRLKMAKVGDDIFHILILTFLHLGQQVINNRQEVQELAR
jgi:hypothetical protein